MRARTKTPHRSGLLALALSTLLAELSKASPDDVAFARRADNLLGLLDAHFEEEEQVLLPYADEQMTRAQFEQAVELKGVARH